MMQLTVSKCLARLVLLISVSFKSFQINYPSTSIKMDGALPLELSEFETDSDIITKLFLVIYLQKL